ncbi:hypothetical protein Pyn_19150 [Prunus yedoensis var. nudiflora]|uniref:Uncharacterized protein n=1 Tax=Prunus yedoensis var. nudiflora TaxID=2094558 RepID=A0A314ZPM6_PRUYE|nr:hypothetical protein Pyn_19150 [Prunus yedoensis var. nudiflora]
MGGQGSVYKAKLPSGSIVEVKKFHEELDGEEASQAGGMLSFQTASSYGGLDDITLEQLITI